VGVFLGGVVFTFIMLLFQIGTALHNVEGEVGAAGTAAFGTVLDGLGVDQFLAAIIKFVTWIYLGAHRLAITVNTGGQDETIHLLTAFNEAGGTLTPLYYQATTVLVLLYGGYHLAGVEPRDGPMKGGLRGMTIAAGYTLVVYIAASLATVERGSTLIGYDPASAALMAAVYAAVFGGLGGIIGGILLQPLESDTEPS